MTSKPQNRPLRCRLGLHKLVGARAAEEPLRGDLLARGIVTCISTCDRCGYERFEVIGGR